MLASENAIRVADHFGSYLASRYSGQQLRQSILSSSRPVTIDFAGVVSASSSFCDEVFGVLSVKLGREWIRERIRVENASPDVEQSIAAAISRREQRPGPGHP